MKNPLILAYKTLDDIIMYGANKAVKIYNWTTGKTKADLANNLLDLSTILVSLGMVNSIPIIPMLGVPVFYYLNKFWKKENINIESREINALEKSSLDGRVEDYKYLASFVSIPFYALSIFIAHGNHNNGYFIKDDAVFDYTLSVGFISHGSSFYVMRADYLPPIKNIFKKTIESLEKLVQKTQIELVPELAEHKHF